MLFMSYQTITVTPSFHTHALPLILRGILRLAKISPMIAQSPARRSRDGREPSGKTSCEMLRLC
jgi:hypothetical protein